MSATGEASVGGLGGDKLYQVRARAALPILVRQARAGQTMVYSELAAELGMPNPRNLNYVLGSIGNSLLELGETWGQKVPPIQALVVNKYSGLPGEGISWFAPDAAEFTKAPTRQRRQIVAAMLSEVFLYSYWDRVLREFGLVALPAPGLTLPPVKDVGAYGCGGEGEAHARLKTAIAANPELVGLPPSTGTGAVEVALYSGDSLDIQFVNAKERIAVEVKPRGAPTGDIVRGLFQCVKYLAVMDAEEKVRHSERDCSVILALGGQLPEDLAGLRATLGIGVVEEVSAG